MHKITKMSFVWDRRAPPIQETPYTWIWLRPCKEIHGMSQSDNVYQREWQNYAPHHNIPVAPTPQRRFLCGTKEHMHPKFTNVQWPKGVWQLLRDRSNGILDFAQCEGAQALVLFGFVASVSTPTVTPDPSCVAPALPTEEETCTSMYATFCWQPWGVYDPLRPRVLFPCKLRRDTTS